MSASHTHSMDTELGVLLQKLQDGQNNLERNQERTTTLLEGMMAGLKDLRSDLTAVERVVHDRAKTQWGTIFGAVGAATTFMMIVGGIISYAYLSDIKSVGHTVSQLRSEFVAHAQMEGHPAVIKQMYALEKAMDLRFGLIDREVGRIRDRLNYMERRGDTDVWVPTPTP